jgi:hypothetical protein
MTGFWKTLDLAGRITGLGSSYVAFNSGFPMPVVEWDPLRVFALFGICF